MATSEHTPVYQAVKEHLKDRIERGELKEGDRVPTEMELARQFGVNRSQTRQAMRDLQLEGYVVRRRGSGTFVAPSANGGAIVKMAGGRSIAIVIPKNIIGHSHHIVEGYMHRTSEEDCQVIIYNMNLTQADNTSEVRFLRSVVESGVSGVVAWITNDSGATYDLVYELVDRRFPLVLVDRYLPDIETDFVVSDNDALCYELTKALIRRGHKRIAFAGVEYPTSSSVRDRLAGYRRALEEASLAFDEKLVMDIDYSEEVPKRAVEGMMAPYESPTAFVCIHSEPFRLLYDPLRELGYRASENIDIAVVDDGCPGVPADVPLIRVSQRGHEIGVQSADLLLKRIAEPSRAFERRFVEPGAVIDAHTGESTQLVSA